MIMLYTNQNTMVENFAIALGVIIMLIVVIICLAFIRYCNNKNNYNEYTPKKLPKQEENKVPAYRRKKRMYI